jgi:uncharacterized protein
MYKYRISEIKLNLDEELSQIPEKIRGKLQSDSLEILSYHISKESVDARDKGHILRVYSVVFETNEILSLEEVSDATYGFLPKELVSHPKQPPVIVGFGPCGIFAAWALVQMGIIPIVLERGKPIPTRDDDVEKFWKQGILNEESNVQYGEGGAGAYSDGKLTTGTRDPRNRLVLQTLVAAGADPEILYKQRPHVGTDVLKAVVTRLRMDMEGQGCCINFSSKMTDILVENHQIIGVEVNHSQVIPTNHLILAIGHSARDTFQMLHLHDVPMSPKPFSMGIRMEHPQKMINQAQYGDSSLAEILGPAEYKLVHHCTSGRGIYSFCMCPGGQVIPASSEEGGVVVNGMSFHARDGLYANSGILTDVHIDDYYKSSPLDGIAFQRKIEQEAYQLTGRENLPPCTKWESFKENKNDILRKCLPEFVTSSLMEGIPAFGKKIHGYDGIEGKMSGVETRSSSPIRVLRNQAYVSDIKGLYPGGEGGGHAGGIVSAAVDGIKLAESIAKGE